MPCRERSNWLKRLTPEAKSRIISSVHLPLMILAVRATGQVVLPVLFLRVTDVVVESIVLHSYDEQRGSRISLPVAQSTIKTISQQKHDVKRTRHSTL